MERSCIVSERLGASMRERVDLKKGLKNEVREEWRFMHCRYHVDFFNCLLLRLSQLSDKTKCNEITNQLRENKN